MASRLSKPHPDVTWAEDGDNSSVGFAQSVLAAVVQFVEQLLLSMHIYSTYRSADLRLIRKIEGGDNPNV